MRHFVCAILGFVCKVLGKRGSFENVYKQLKKTVMRFFFWGGGGCWTIIHLYNSYEHNTIIQLKNKWGCFHWKFPETECKRSVKSSMQRVCVCQVCPRCCFVHKVPLCVYMRTPVYMPVCVTSPRGVHQCNRTKFAVYAQSTGPPSGANETGSWYITPASPAPHVNLAHADARYLQHNKTKCKSSQHNMFHTLLWQRLYSLINSNMPVFNMLADSSSFGSQVRILFFSSESVNLVLPFRVSFIPIDYHLK